MRIVQFTRFYYPHIGGVEKHVCEVDKRLASKNHKVTVITEKYYDRMKSYEKFKGDEIYRIPNIHDEKNKKFTIWIWLLNHRKLIQQADVIHCHDVFFWYLPFRFLYPFKKVFTTFHGYEGNKIPDWKSKLNHKLAEVLSYGNICVGDYLTKWYGTKADAITYGAVTVKKMTKPCKKNTAVFVGRLEEEANILKYLKALKILQDKGIKIPLTVLGDGSLRQKAEKYVKDHKLSVTFKGFVPDVLAFIPDYEFVFTSRFLGTLEAMSLKKFVFVIYNTPILKDCFALSPFANVVSLTGDSKSLAREIEKYRNDTKARDAKITLGYEWVRKQTWEKMANQYLTLWKL